MMLPALYRPQRHCCLMLAWHLQYTGFLVDLLDATLTYKDSLPNVEFLIYEGDQPVHFLRGGINGQRYAHVPIVAP